MMKRIYLIIIFALLLIPVASAMDWDNVKTYDEESQTITITNALGLGERLARIQLMTPLENKVGVGKDIQVALLKIHKYKKMDGALSGTATYDVKRDMIPIDKEITMKYRVTTREYQIPIYNYSECIEYVEGEDEEGNKVDVCLNWTIIGYEDKEDYEWIEFADVNELPDINNIFIGLYADTIKGEKVEWIPDRWYGERIEEWATYTASNFDDFEDNDISDWIVYNTDSGNAEVNTNGADSTTYNLNIDDVVDATGSKYYGVYKTITAIADGEGYQWYMRTDNVAGNYPSGLYFSQDTGSNRADNGWVQLKFDNGDLDCRGEDNTKDGELVGSGLSDDTWYFANVTFDTSAKEAYFEFWNEGKTSLLGSHTCGWTTAGDLDVILVENMAGNNVRDLSIDEIYELNLVSDNSPTVTLNSPANDTEFKTQSVTFNCSAYDDINLDNVTLYIDGVANETNSSGLNNTDYIFTKTLDWNTDYNWTCVGVDNASQEGTTETYVFSINNTKPNTTLNSPANSTTYKTQTIEFNCSAYDDIDLDNVTLVIDGVDNGTSIDFLAASNTNVKDPANAYDGDEGTGASGKVGFTGYLYLNYSVAEETESVDISFVQSNSVTGEYYDGSSWDSFSSGDSITSGNFTGDLLQLKFTLPSDKILYEVYVEPTNNTNIIFSRDWFDWNTDYNWSCKSTDAIGQTHTPTAREFSINNTAPVVTLNSPVNNSNFTTNSVTFNCSAFDDVSLSSVELLIDGSVNQTNSSGLNNTNYIFDVDGLQWENQFNWSCRATDSISNTTTAAIRLFNTSLAINTSLSYTSPIVEGFSDTYTFILDAVNISSFSANLIWNGTAYAMSGSDNGTRATYTTSLTMPEINTDTNYTVYVDYNVSGYNNNTETENQTVINGAVDNCSVHTDELINTTLFDEETQALITGDIEIDVEIYKLGAANTLIANHSESFTSVSNARICVPADLLENTNFTMNSLILYEGDDSAKEYYNIQNETITKTNTAFNISLYGLNSSDSTAFLITFKDDGFLPEQDALIEITRNYVGDGVFRTVEIPITDDQGQTIAHLDTDNVVYTIIVKKYGEILGTYDNVLARCEDTLTGDCKINLYQESTVDDYDKWDEKGGISYSMSFDESTRDITLTYTSVGGSAKTVLLQANQVTTSDNNDVCNDTVTSSSGTLTCSIPSSYGNATVYAEVYSDGSKINSAMYTIDVNPRDFIGFDGIIFTIVLLITLPLLFLGNKIVMLIMAVVSMVIAALLLVFEGINALSITSMIVWLVVAIGIIVWRISKEI